MHALSCLRFQETVKSVGYIPPQLRQHLQEGWLFQGYLDWTTHFGCWRLGQANSFPKGSRASQSASSLTHKCVLNPECLGQCGACIGSAIECTLSASVLHCKGCSAGGYKSRAGRDGWVSVTDLYGIVQFSLGLTQSWLESLRVYLLSSRRFGAALCLLLVWLLPCSLAFCKALAGAGSMCSQASG